jgi:hypothetical protein
MCKVKYVIITGNNAIPTAVQVAGVKYYPVPTTYDRKLLIGRYLCKERLDQIGLQLLK